MNEELVQKPELEIEDQEGEIDPSHFLKEELENLTKLEEASIQNKINSEKITAEFESKSIKLEQ